MSANWQRFHFPQTTITGSLFTVWFNKKEKKYLCEVFEVLYDTKIYGHEKRIFTVVLKDGVVSAFLWDRSEFLAKRF